MAPVRIGVAGGFTIEQGRDLPTNTRKRAGGEKPTEIAQTE
jgi:hypothetical protein